LPYYKTFSSIYMEETLKGQLKKLAEIENRSLNSYINIVLKKHTCEER